MRPEHDKDQAHRFFEHGVHVVEEVTVARPAGELYAYWRRLSNLADIMSHVEEVVEIDAERSHWKVDGPGGEYEWDAQVINDIPGELIAWKTAEGSEPANAGSVVFRPTPDGRGTVVRVTLEYIPPAGVLGQAVARLMGDDPATTLRKDLREYQERMESGRTVTAEGREPPRRLDTPGM